MANYVKATNFYTKDALLTGNPSKIIKGSEIDAEYNAIATAIASKADTTSPTFTGTPIAPTASAGTSTTQLATTAFVATAVGTPGTMAAQNANAVAITGGTVAATFTGNLTGNVTGNTSGSAGSCTGNSATVTNGIYTTNFTGANQSLGTSGYQKLPGGLIIQWGVTANISGNSSVVVTFPIAFTTLYSVVGGKFGGSASQDGGSGLLSATTTTVTAYNGSDSILSAVSWIAIGV
jgi:hypothetical protein